MRKNTERAYLNISNRLYAMQRELDFTPNAYSVLEDIVLDFERGKPDYKAFKADMLRLEAILKAETPEFLQIETFDKYDSARWKAGLSTCGLVSCSDKRKSGINLVSLVWHLLTESPSFGKLLLIHRDDIDYYLQEGEKVPTIAYSGNPARYGTLDNLSSIMRICGYEENTVCSMLQGERDFLKIRVYRKESK